MPRSTSHPTPGDWVWLLHDDCAPAPDALAELLAEVHRDPRTAVAGPKVLGLGDRRLLLEVGVTIARSGRRDVGLERREHDQGQHDGVRPVLAVGTAGMLVRRDVWDELGGLDPRLPLLRDDVDLGWRANLAGHRVVVVTDAVLHHAEAASHRRRPVHVAGGRLHRLDRQHALYVLLANLPLPRLLIAVPVLTVMTLLRALGLLAGKRPAHAADETFALLALLVRPDRLVRARRARRRTRQVPARTAMPLLASRGSGVRHAMETPEPVPRHQRRRGRRRPAPGRLRGRSRRGPTSEDADDLPSSGVGLLRRLFLRPSVLLAAGADRARPAVACAGCSARGRLMGGALLPAPAAAGDLWHTYISTWHPVGLGGDTAAPPYLAVLAGLASVLLGSAERAVDLLLLAAVPLAGITAYVALRRLVRSVPLQVWGAVGYALLPPVLGAVAAGRLGTAVAAVLLPLLVAGRRACARAGRPATELAGGLGGRPAARGDGGVRPDGLAGRCRRRRRARAGAGHREPGPLAAAGRGAGARAAAAPAAVAAGPGGRPAAAAARGRAARAGAVGARPRRPRPAAAAPRRAGTPAAGPGGRSRRRCAGRTAAPDPPAAGAAGLAGRAARSRAALWR